MTTFTIAKSINFPKIIAAILIAGYLSWSTIILLLVGFLVEHGVSVLGYSLAGVISLYWGLAYKWLVAVTILAVIWGITLFIRYIRLCQAKLKMSTRRLWIETILINALCLSLLYTLPGVVIPYAVVLTCWTIFAMLLAGIALVSGGKRQFI